MKNKKIVVIVGAEGCGLTLVQEALDALGVKRNTLPGGIGVATAVDEREAVAALNRRLMAAPNAATAPVVLDSAAAPIDRQPAQADARAALADYLRHNEVVCFSGAELPDVLRYWQRLFAELGCEPRYLVAVRNPRSVVQSRQRSGGDDPLAAYQRWLDSTLAALAQTAHAPSLVVDYDMLVDEPALQMLRIAQFLDLPPVSASLLRARPLANPALRHSVNTLEQLEADATVPPAAVSTYRILHDKAQLDAPGTARASSAAADAAGVSGPPGRSGANPVARSLRSVARGARRRLRSLLPGRSGGTPAALPLRPDIHEFDPQYYLRHNPDVAASGADPYQHYLMHGKAEGRLAAPLRLGDTEAFRKFDPQRETVMVVSHEASLTGAPVLSWNLAKAFSHRYNVVVLLLGGGPLLDNFKELGVAVVGPLPNIIKAPHIADSIIADILRQGPIKFAATNSSVSTAVCAALANRHIPNVPLIHEFAAYTRPRGLFLNAMLWSGHLVFSTDLTLQSALRDEPALKASDCEILPQGRCVVPAEAKAATGTPQAVGRLRRQVLGGADKNGTIIVLGLGTVQLRKGVDLFIAAARRMVELDPDTPYRFVWIGPNFRPDTDFEYSAYLVDQIHRSGLENRLVILPETPHIEVAYGLADMLLLSSRLDPLPNVAVDVISHGVPLVCFAETTGLATLLAGENLAADCVAGYLDVNDMAAKAVALARDAAHRQTVCAALQDRLLPHFDMRRYVQRIEALASQREKALQRERADVETIAQSGLIDPGFSLPRGVSHLAPLQIANLHVRCWASGITLPKPFPGFHPGIYREARMSAHSEVNPLAQFIRAGQPAGPWLTEVFNEATAVAEVSPPPRVALHLHVYYPDLLPGMLEALQGNVMRPDLYISVPNASARAQAAAMLSDYTGHVASIVVVPNRGRDIGPLFSAFGADLRQYDIIGHLHTKKTVDIADPAVGEVWHRYLMTNLLGGSHAMGDRIVSRLASDASLGMVFPDDPNCIGWDSNREYAEPLARRLGLDVLPDQFNFPVGTMFWARTAALMPLFDLGLDWHDYPQEPLGYDGSMLHALERLLPLVAMHAGMRIAVTRCGNSRR